MRRFGIRQQVYYTMIGMRNFMRESNTRKSKTKQEQSKGSEIAYLKLLCYYRLQILPHSKSTNRISAKRLSYVNGCLVMLDVRHWVNVASPIQPKRKE